MTQTDTQNWDLAGKALDYLHGLARVFRSARPGRDDYSIGPQMQINLFNPHVVIPADFDRLSQLAEILHEVVSERIVVVDDQEHCRFPIANCRFDFLSFEPNAFCSLHSVSPVVTRPAHCSLPTAHFFLSASCSSIAMFPCPFFAAQPAAVTPSMSLIRASAPFAKSTCTISSRP